MSNQEEHDRKPQLPYIDPGLLINTRLSEVERQQREDRAEEKKHKSDQLKINKSIAVFTGLLFVTSVLSDCLLLYQASLNKESADAAKSAAMVARDALDSNDISSFDTLIQMKAQNRALEHNERVAGKALDASIEASRNDQRAWLSISNFRIVKDPTIGETFSVVYSISNSGKTPAMMATSKIQLAFDYGEPKVRDWAAIVAINRSVIFPNTTSRDISQDVPATQVTKAVVDEYVAHRTKIYIRIRVDYSDVYGRPHWSEVCTVHTFGDPADRWLNDCAIAGDVDTQKDNRKK